MFWLWRRDGLVLDVIVWLWRRDGLGFRRDCLVTDVTVGFQT